MYTITRVLYVKFTIAIEGNMSHTKEQFWNFNHDFLTSINMEKLYSLIYKKCYKM